MYISAKERAERRVNEYRAQVDEVVTELKKRYTDFANAPGTIEQLRLENSDLPIHYLTYWIPKAFKVDAIKYLEEVGIINYSKKHLEKEGIINHSKKWVNKMNNYNVSIKCNNKNDLELLALFFNNMYYDIDEFLLDMENGELSVDNDSNITIKDNKADIIFNDVTYMDLPNVYDDPSDSEMFYHFKSVISIKKCVQPFVAEFEFCVNSAGYQHFGKCEFDGKKIEYSDTVNLSPHEPIEHMYSVELSDDKFINEKKEAFYKYSGDPAPLEIPEEYYD